MTVSFVQRESELLLIPPDWWHQTYHLCATVAVASQLMNPHVAQSVHSHILRWTGAERDIPLEALKQMEPSEQIRRVLHAACRRRHGPEEGDRVAAEMFGKGD